MIYGYARVSTSGQQLHGNSLLEQEKALKENGCNIICREAFTGSTTHRPELLKLAETLQPGDTLMVTKLDRLARNVTEGIQMVQAMFSRQVKVHVLNIGLLEDTAMGKFFITTLLAVAELEKSIIYERTQAGKAVAREKIGYKEGRPRIPDVEIAHALMLLKDHAYREVTEITGISKATLARYKAQSIKEQEYVPEE